ncbi:MAG: JAB domain-containing protein [Alteromonadales bacterium]|nr:JAB domain-containing protein [Alteromonadales bacterium]
MTTIKEWPNQERPREKLLSKGSSALSDAELLAIFLRTGSKGIDVVTLSRLLLTEFGSLHALFAASESDFCAKKGLGQAKYAQLQAVLEMSRRYLQEPLQKGLALTSAQQTKDFLSAKMHAYPYEVFAALLLDTRHQIICFHEFFFGSIDSATVHPRIIAQKVLHENAAAIILVHNHPSGDPTASICDKKITQKIVDTMSLIDVRVLDHFIIGHQKITSFAEKGWI